MLKICTKCGIEKEGTEFRKWRTQCKKCESEDRKAYSKTPAGIATAERFNKSLHRKEYLIEYNKRYVKTQSCKDSRSKPARIEYMKSYGKVYAKTPKRIKKQKEYNQSYEGKLVQKKCAEIRKTEYGFKPINSKFDGASSHHLLYDCNFEKDPDTVIYIPKELHPGGHGRRNPARQRDVNIAATEWLMNNGETEDIKKIAAYLHYKYCLMPIPTWFKDEYNKSKEVVHEK